MTRHSLRAAPPGAGAQAPRALAGIAEGKESTARSPIRVAALNEASAEMHVRAMGYGASRPVTEGGDRADDATSDALRFA